MWTPIFSSYDVLNYTSEGINPLEPKHSFVGELVPEGIPLCALPIFQRLVGH